MKLEQTNRGFDILKFNDSYNVECSLQKSSSALEDKIWFGCNSPNIKVFNKEKGLFESFQTDEDLLVTTRMHLTREQVKELLPYLQKFVETGELTS